MKVIKIVVGSVRVLLFLSCDVTVLINKRLNEGVSKSFRTDRLERKLQMVQPSATRCSCIAILWVSLASFDAITLCVIYQRVIPKVSVIDSVRKLLVTPYYFNYCFHRLFIIRCNKHVMLEKNSWVEIRM